MKRSHFTLAISLALAGLMLGWSTANAQQWQAYRQTKAAKATVGEQADDLPTPEERKLAESDTTIYLERGNHAALTIIGTPNKKEVISFNRNIDLLGRTEIRHALLLVPEDGWIDIKAGAVVTFEDVQILGLGPPTEMEGWLGDTGNLSTGMAVNNRAVVNAKDLIIAGHAFGLRISTGDEDPPARRGAKFVGENIYITNNAYGAEAFGYIDVADSVGIVDILASAIWNNRTTAFSIGDYRFEGTGSVPSSMNLKVTGSWIQGRVTFSGLTEFSRVIFDRTILPPDFIPSLYHFRQTVDPRGESANLVTTLENRPLGVVQTWPLDQVLDPLDFDANRVVNLADVTFLAQGFGNPRDVVVFGNLYDLNNDGQVDLRDLLLWIGNYLGLAPTASIEAIADKLANSLEGKELLKIASNYPTIVDAVLADPILGPVLMDYMQPTAVAEESMVPTTFGLGQNYPNPFNPETTINFSLGAETMVRLSVYNLAGQSIKTLAVSTLPAGTHQLTWDGTDDAGRAVGSGIYLCDLHAGKHIFTKKMLLLR